MRLIDLDRQQDNLLDFISGGDVLTSTTRWRLGQIAEGRTRVKTELAGAAAAA